MKMVMIVSCVVLGLILVTSCDASLRATSKLDQDQVASTDIGAESKTFGGRHLSEETAGNVDVWSKLLAGDPRYVSHLAMPEATRVHPIVEDSGGRQLTNTPVQSQITSLQLINANTDEVIVTLKDGMVIALDAIKNMTTPAFNINATFVNGTGIRSVKYGYNNTNRYRVETTAPYTFCGNNRTDYFSCSRLGLGTHTVTVTPYARSNAAGTPGTSITVTFTIVASDVTPPRLLNFTALTPTTVDVTNGNATIDVLITLVDDTSPVGLCRLSYNYAIPDFNRPVSEAIERGSEVWSWLVYPDSVPRQPVTIVVPVIIPKYYAAGVYPFQLNIADLVPTMPKYRNADFLNASALAAKGFVSKFTVVNTGFVDSTDSQLISFTNTTSLTVNTTKGPGSIEFQVTVKDELSGFSYGGIYAAWEYMEFGKSGVIECCTNDDIGPDLPPNVLHTFTVPMIVGNYTPPGEYKIEVYLVDGVKNAIFFDETELAALGLPSKVIVVA